MNSYCAVHSFTGEYLDVVVEVEQNLSWQDQVSLARVKIKRATQVDLSDYIIHLLD